MYSRNPNNLNSRSTMRVNSVDMSKNLAGAYEHPIVNTVNLPSLPVTGCLKPKYGLSFGWIVKW
jgi:hypothetical protein